MIDLERFRRTPLVREPFDHLIVSGFVREQAAQSIMADFPAIDEAGSFPSSELSFGRAFGALLDELRGPELEKAVSEKFDIDLSGRPTMLTVRGRARNKDGRIHTDSRTKLVTVLLYMNPGWSAPGGWLRLLRSPTSLDDFFAEAAPELGTAAFFRCTPNAWHGHTPFVGVRRTIQLNWVTDASVVRREQGRHRLSARLKSWIGKVR